MDLNLFEPHVLILSHLIISIMSLMCDKNDEIYLKNNVVKYLKMYSKIFVFLEIKEYLETVVQ